VLEECISVMEFKAEEKGLDMYYEIDDEVPDKIVID
jgi:hypothetical protein